MLGQRTVDLVGFGDKVGVGVGLAAFLEQHLPVRAFLAGNEVNPVVVRGERLDVGKPVGYLTTDRIVVFEDDIFRHAALDLRYNRLKTVQRFGCLREKVDGAMEIQAVQILFPLNHDGVTLRLANQAVYLRMSFLAVNDQLGTASLDLLLVALMDFSLQAQDDRAGRVNDLYPVAPGDFISGGRLAMCPEKHLFPFQLAELLMLDGAQAHLLKALNLKTIVHDISQAVKPVAVRQLALGALDRRDDPETES